jgi:hypothetical protein
MRLKSTQNNFYQNQLIISHIKNLVWFSKKGAPLRLLLLSYSTLLLIILRARLTPV